MWTIIFFGLFHWYIWCRTAEERQEMGQQKGMICSTEPQVGFESWDTVEYNVGYCDLKKNSFDIMVVTVSTLREVYWNTMTMFEVLLQRNYAHIMVVQKHQTIFHMGCIYSKISASKIEYQWGSSFGTLKQNLSTLEAVVHQLVCSTLLKLFQKSLFWFWFTSALSPMFTAIILDK